MTLERFKPMQMGCLEAETTWSNRSTEKPGTLPKKPVSRREDAITQEKVKSNSATFCCPISTGVRDEAVFAPVTEQP